MIQMKTLLKRTLPINWDMYPLNANTRRYMKRQSNIFVDEHIASEPFDESQIYVHLTVRCRTARPSWETLEEIRDIFIGAAMDTRALKQQLFFDTKVDSNAIDLWLFYPQQVIQEYLASAWEGSVING